jgi:DNA-binding MarR family transcriptional regulator
LIHKDKEKSSKTPQLDEDLAYEILNSCRQLVSLVHKTSRATEKELGLSSAQLYVLNLIGSSEAAVSVNDLANLTRTHQSSVSVVVKKLAEKDLISTKPSKGDARKLEIRILAKGKKLLAESSTRETLPDTFLKAIKEFKNEEGKDLKRLLDQLLKAAEFKDETARLFLEND